MEAGKVRYPIGIQTFSDIIEGGYLYVDKTAYVYKLANEMPKYLFLNRPRRFGKSLLLSTLNSYLRVEKSFLKVSLLKSLRLNGNPIL